MKKYQGIHWLRVLGCTGIMAMHMIANNAYKIDGFIYNRVIPSFTDFVFLFMAISAFGMCSGYFEKVMSGKVNWTAFYRKRYGKLLPFFLFLVILDILINFSSTALWEGLAEITLLHGFLPYSLSVIGVGWFLGIVFIFYLIFPFFCVLMETKGRAWLAFGISLLLNYICTVSFNLDRTNFLYCLCYFLAGGLVYLYRKQLQNVKWYVYLLLLSLVLCLYYRTGGNTATRLLVTAASLAFAISANCPPVGMITFLSGISLEFYLSHMVIFRAMELLDLNTRWGSGWGQYFITVSLVFLGTTAFSFGFQFLQKSIMNHRTEEPH